MKLFGAVLLVTAVSLGLGVDGAGAGNSAVGTAKISGNKNMKAPVGGVPAVLHQLDCAVLGPSSLPPLPLTGQTITFSSKVVITNNTAGVTVPAGFPIKYVVAGHTYVSADAVDLHFQEKFLIDFNSQTDMACTATASF